METGGGGRGSVVDETSMTYTVMWCIRDCPQEGKHGPGVCKCGQKRGTESLGVRFKLTNTTQTRHTQANKQDQPASHKDDVPEQGVRGLTRLCVRGGGGGGELAPGVGIFSLL